MLSPGPTHDSAALPSTVFFELFEQFVETATKQASDSPCAKHAAQDVWLITLRLRLSAASGFGKGASSVVEHLCELVPILIPRKRKHPKERSHRWHSTAHVCLLHCYLRPARALTERLGNFGEGRLLGLADLNAAKAEQAATLARRFGGTLTDLAQPAFKGCSVARSLCRKYRRNLA